MRYRDDGETHEMMMARKVDMSTFVWAIGLLSGLMIAVAGWCFTEISSLRADTAATEAKVQAYINNGNISTQNILLSLGKLQTDVEWIRRQIDAAPRATR